MSKIYFCAMAGPNSVDNLIELIDPIHRYFDGIVVVLHDARDSDEDYYLESIKDEGAVIHLPFARRHDFSRNAYLWCGPIQEDDWIVQCDVLERIPPAFAANLRSFIADLESQSINAVFYYNKPFIYQQHESLEFTGSPHEGLRRHDGKMKAIELSKYYPNEPDIRYSVRATKRDTPFSWVGHYFKYYLYPYGSNHCLLGNCDRGDEMAIFKVRETMRNSFRDELKRRGVPRTAEAVKDHWVKVPLDATMRRFVNEEKVLNDAYRYFILNDLTVRDEHKWDSLKTIS